MLASSSMVPDRVKTAPRPQLKRGFSSRATTAVVAASRADLPARRAACVECVRCERKVR